MVGCGRGVLLFFAVSLLGQTRYEVTAGEAVPIAATALTSKSRIVAAPGLVVAPDRAGHLVLAASALAKPGEYSVTVGNVSMTAAVKALTPVPSGSKRNPVVLLNGWEEGFTNACPVSNSSADTFGNLAQYLVADGVPVVYLFDNCAVDPNQTIENLGNDLGLLLNSIKYDTGAQVPQIDLVAFSLGGLIARSYLAGLQVDGTLTPPTETLVGKLVLI